MRVAWREDLRPMPEDFPGAEKAAFDKNLIIVRRGEVVSSIRTVFGLWVFLVYCDDGEFREVQVKKVKVI